MRVYYDLHIHSCLSPCGDADMTPNNIVNMARLAGLSAIALTDHNACGNCPAILEAAPGERARRPAGDGALHLGGGHVVCLFPTLEAALAFEARIRPTLPPLKTSLKSLENSLSSTGRIPSPGIRMPSWPGRRGSAWTRPPRWRAPSAGRPSRPIFDRPSYSVPAALGDIPPGGVFRRGGDRHGGSGTDAGPVSGHSRPASAPQFGRPFPAPDPGGGPVSGSSLQHPRSGHRGPER